jgi:hypothetical protein
MPNTRSTSLLWGLICALALVVGLIAGRLGLAGQSNALSLANFRPDFPLKEIREKTFKNETVQLDGNAFIDCTFDNVILKFDGQAPFRFTNDHFENRLKLGITSNNPVIKSTIELVSVFMKLENAAQNQLKENK